MTRKKSLYMVGADGIEETRFQLRLIESEDAAPTDTQGPLSSLLLHLCHCLTSQREGRGEREGRSEREGRVRRVQFQI